MLYYTKRFIIIASAVISTIIVIAYSYVFKDKKFEFTAKINENIIQNIQQEEKIINKSKEEKWAIKIPSINLEAPIKEGTTDEILNQYVGHFTETKTLKGNIGLAAHNRGYKVNYFKDLKNLKEGDEIIYIYQENERKYTVKQNIIIESTDWSKLENTQENTLTLIICVENKPQNRRCIQAKEK